MRGKKWFILLASLALVLLASSIGVTGSFLVDLESSTGNTFQAWTSREWVQTTQADFEAGVLNNVDTSSSPGDVKLAEVGWGSYSPELLVNPGAETGDTTGWTAVGTHTANFVAGTECHSCPSGGAPAGPRTGTYSFMWNAPTTSDDWAYQEIDLFASGFEEKISAGEAQLKAGGYLVCGECNANWDRIQLRILLYDSGHSLIETSYDSGQLFQICSWTWYGIADYDIPTNARYVRVEFQTIEPPSWGAGKADDLTVKVRVTEQSFWYDTNWQYRREITIDHTKVEDVDYPSTTYANFPVLVYATGLSNIKADGADIRFTLSDGVTEIPREIESYSGGTLYAWVKVTLTKDNSDADDDVIYMYYGNAAATEPAPASACGSQNVWDNNFVMVQHLQEDPTDPNPAFKDSTSNDNDGSNWGSMTASDQVIGQVDGSIDFDGLNDRINLGNIGTLSNNTFSISVWVKVPDPSPRQEMVWGAVTGSSDERFRFEVYDTWINFHDDYNMDTWTSSGTIEADEWYHVVATYDYPNQTASIYLNGEFKASDTSFSQASNALGGLQIGSRDGACYLNGVIDEVRISNIAISADWIKTEYNNQSSPSTFYSVGSEKGMYISSGTIASQVWDTGVDGARWDGLFWDEILPSNTNITFEVRASDTLFAKDTPDATLPWISVGGTSPITSGLPSGRYMQWRATLTTSDTSKTPILQEVRVYHY